MLAVLARNGGPALGASDVFVSIAGSLRIEEPGADLAIALAVASAARGAPLGGEDGRPVAAFGEIGLTGELRYVAHPERRVAEAAKFGLGPVLSPAGDAPTLRAAVAAALGGRRAQRAAA